MSDAALTLFIPFGEGYGNPGLTLRGETADELAATIGNLSEQNEEDTSNLDRILDGVLLVKAAVNLKGLSVAKNQNKTENAPVTHPQASAAPSSAPNCAHGPMRWKDAVTKSGQNAGKRYTAWVCTAPYGQTQCKMQDFKYL